MLSHAALLHKSVFESIRIFAGARRVLVSGFSVWRRRRPRNCRRSILHTTAETLYAVYIHAERINSGSKWDVAPGQRRWKDEKFRPQQQRCMWACKSMRVGCCGEGNDLLVASQLQDKEIVGCACNHCHCAPRDSLVHIPNPLLCQPLEKFTPVSTALGEHCYSVALVALCERNAKPTTQNANDDVLQIKVGREISHHCSNTRRTWQAP